MPDKTPCTHEKIARDSVMNGHGYMWTCPDCMTNFVPIDAVMAQEQKSEEILDTVTAVFSATLWDLHERAFEAHGVSHLPNDPVAESVCEAKGHDPDDDGTCKRCGHSPFLGGGS